MSGNVSKVVVLGGGVGAAMAALAIARAFGRLGVEILWIERTGETSPHGVMVAPPDLATFHRLLGIEEAALVANAAATLNMGQQFASWDGGSDAFLHAYGDAGEPFASLPFLQYWSRARRAGLAVPLEDFSLAAAAAKHGRFGPTSEGAAGQSMKHGYHLDAQAYAGLLRQACIANGVRLVSGEGVEFITHDGRVTAIALPGGDRVDADLFVDADGDLIAAVDPNGMVEGAPWCDRLIRASAPPFDPLPLFSRVAAHDAGWLTLVPLADRTAIEFAYAGAEMTDEAAAEQLIRLVGRSIRADDTAQQVRARRRPRPWVGNCVAIGSAAMDAPLLDGAELLLLQLAIAQLVLLWPLESANMPEADTYNEEMAGSQARIADFTAMHFRLNRRAGQPFWDAARAAIVSDALQAKIALFEARGMIAHLNYEAHVDDSWAFCMTGHGLLPRSSDPQADRVGDEALMMEFRRRLGAIATTVRSMETHVDALNRIRMQKA